MTMARPWNSGTNRRSHRHVLLRRVPALPRVLNTPKGVECRRSLLSSISEGVKQEPRKEPSGKEASDKARGNQLGQSILSPRGTLISATITVSEGALRPVVERCLQIVDTIHGARPWPMTTVGYSSQIRQEGVFIPGVSGEGSRIVISTKARAPELTALQEIGHLVDYDGLGRGYGYYSATAARGNHLAWPDWQTQCERCCVRLSKARLARAL